MLSTGFDVLHPRKGDEREKLTIMDLSSKLQQLLVHIKDTISHWLSMPQTNYLIKNL